MTRIRIYYTDRPPEEINDLEVNTISVGGTISIGGTSITGVGGSVGIGSTLPRYNLDVGGDINFSGSLYQNDTLFSGGG